MLRPSYTELMDVLNKDENVDMKVTSRYTIVIAASKRARQIIDGDEPRSQATSDKAVSIAINEMYEGKLAISLSEDSPVDRYDELEANMGNEESGEYGTMM